MRRTVVALPTAPTAADVSALPAPPLTPALPPAAAWPCASAPPAPASPEELPLTVLEPVAVPPPVSTACPDAAPPLLAVAELLPACARNTL